MRINPDGSVSITLLRCRSEGDGKRADRRGIWPGWWAAGTTYCATKFAQNFSMLLNRAAAAGRGCHHRLPGVVATEIRRNGWNAAGERAGSSGL